MTATVSTQLSQRYLTTLFLVSFGIYLFIATVTYTPFDPGWMHLSSDTRSVSNASGVAGAWIADLLFGFLGWAAVLLPLFMFVEAVGLWWPHSYLNRPFRYAAQFFLLLATSSLLYLYWHVPADTLDNAAGGIIGYELGQSLTAIMTIYGATAFLLLLWWVLFTLAFGVRWHKTWALLKQAPAYTREIFYKPTGHDLLDNLSQPDPHAAEQLHQAQLRQQQIAQLRGQQSSISLDSSAVVSSIVASAAETTHLQNQQPSKAVADGARAADAFEQTLQTAHQLEQDSQRLIQSGEVWRALQQDSHQHKQDIDALLRAADDSMDDSYNATGLKQSSAAVHVVSAKAPAVDWQDDQIFDELLASMPNDTQPEHTTSSVTTTSTAPQDAVAVDDVVFREFASVALVDDAESNIKPESNLVAHPAPAPLSDALSDLDRWMADTTAPDHSDATRASEASPQALSKEDFIQEWQATAGQPEAEPAVKPTLNDDSEDWDAPLTDKFGRPMSRALQVLEKRRDLPTLPGLELLDPVDPHKKVNFTAEQLARLSELLEIKLQEFNVKAKVIEAQPGPVVTRFELDLAAGVKASKVTNISRDLARSMSMASVRVVEVIPGKPYIGIEVPNASREMVRLTELLHTPDYRDPNALISMAMGKDISGKPVLTDLAKAPHMLVAGTTGSGKSVAVNSMLLSMLLKYTPDQLRLILIDPKQLELANYSDIPHLLTPVVTDMKDAVSALNWCVNEMERRYKLMSFLKVRKINDYNRVVLQAIETGADLIDPTWKPSDSATQSRAPRLDTLPMIVIVADEFADMIMQVGKKAEEMITRLAQKSRAAGIHLLLATQRPSVDVITGLIKANIPTRVALRVNSKIDSRTILDAGGAEDLLGHGDMLFLAPGKIEPERVHGAFISDDEVNRICDAWRERGFPNYVDEILTPYDEEPTQRSFEDLEGAGERDALYDQAVAFVLETRKASTSSLQRKFSLGYNRAARLVDMMEENGIVSPMGPNGKRDILV